MNITAAILAAAFGQSVTTMAQWVDPVNHALAKASINTKERIAMFLAQTGHESLKYTVVRENLNYGVDGLLSTFAKYFKSTTQAAQYARKPQAIASYVYANRNGNGNEASGEGWKYRGRGLIQVTGKNNYTACGKFLGLDLVANPELLETNENAALSAAWFWQANNLNAYADKKDVRGCTIVINGGTNGLADRQSIYDKALKALA